MPTILQSALLWLVIIGYSSITSIYMLAHFVIVWWRNRSTFFRKQIHPRPAVLDAPEWRHRNVHLSKVQLHIVECVDNNAGGDNPTNSDKPVMLFVHGFPEFWYSWRFQLRHFRDKFRTVAVDLRGYNDSDKPAGVANYEAEVLVADIIELIEVLGGNVVLVGHDWGGALSWIVATERPDLVQRLVIMNGPHGKFLTKIMRTKSVQLIKSWYMFFFQCPLLPELWIWNNDFAMLGECFIGNNKMSLVHKENFTAEDLEAWKYVFSKPNGITPPINYYRALMRAANRQIHYDTVRPKTLIIWGELDKALEMEIAELSVGICRDAKLVKIPDSSHWVQQDVPEKVNAIMEEWLAEN